MLSGDTKELWLQDCLKWFPKLDVNKGNFDAPAIVHTGSSPILLFSPMTTSSVTIML